MIMNHGDILDFAIDEATNQLVHIGQVRKGLQCNCRCPTCGRRLIARKGVRYRHHFSHLPDELRLEPCSGGPETGLHLAAKQIIARWRYVDLPPLIVTEKAKNQFGVECEATLSIPAERMHVVEAILPDETPWTDDWIPDVVLRAANREVRIEVKVTNGVSGSKQAKVQRDGFPTLEYDLSSLKNECGWTWESLEHLLRNDTKVIRWVFHPGDADLRARAKRQLSDEVNKSLAKIALHAPVSGDGELVFHPWLGLVPRDNERRLEFIESHFQPPKTYRLPGGVEIRVRRHASIEDSWLVSFYDTKDMQPMASVYSALLTDFLIDRNLRSVYFGWANQRIVRGARSIEPLVDFTMLQSSLPH